MMTRCLLVAAVVVDTVSAFQFGNPKVPAVRATGGPLAAGGFENTVRTVSGTIRAFDTAYPRPIITLWRSPLNDMLQTTHLSTVDERYQYDELFGFGFLTLMDKIMAAYPADGEGDKITDALLTALDMEPTKVRGDYAAVTAWLDGKTEADVLAAAAAGSGSPVAAAAATIKATAEYHHTRPGNVGLLVLMDTVGVKADKDGLGRWTEAFGMRVPAVERHAGLLKEYAEKMAGAMQVVKAMEIREKKRMADQLEAKAKAAQEKAEAASSAAAEKAAEA